jgi:cytochrome c556
MTKPVSRLTAAAAAAFLVAIAPAAADVTLKNEDMVAVRQAFMRVNSSYEGMLAAQAKGALDIPANQMKQIGEAWVRMGKLLPSLFQKGSEGVGKSRAKPEIWSEPEAFQAKLARYAKATEKFQQVAPAGDKASVAATFAEINNACDDCHKSFRTPAQR